MPLPLLLQREPPLRQKKIAKMKKKQPGLNPDLEKAVTDLLAASKNVEDIEVRLKIIDRAINLEKIRLKINDDQYGSGFMIEDDAE